MKTSFCMQVNMQWVVFLCVHFKQVVNYIHEKNFVAMIQKGLPHLCLFLPSPEKQGASTFFYVFYKTYKYSLA